ncbi:transcriptional elongation regulator MINIYO [Cornus florida]|uniref:transcriptional elongation regulator MINIYO n=1 Tax=Cornus florida TaxID=4283 RepID=UPI0028984A10|nr:transcriptional elongation regulator MINIYO [Cornus florida]
MKKDSSKPPRQRILGSKSLQISEDEASCLVGSIVEKGISENPQKTPLQPPRATVLPFPVARHRSDGPHWAPTDSKNSGGGDDIYDEEDEDLAEFDPIGVFANPVQRKQKEGLDFSRWRELIATDNSFVSHKSQADKHLLVESKEHRKVSEVTEISGKINNHIDATDNGLSKTSVNAIAQNVVMEEEMSGNAITGTPGEITGQVSKRQRQMDTEMQNMSELHVPSRSTSSNLGNEQGSISLESQIDVENRARLQGMSTDEIEEAQAEILEKMNPALIEALRKRGQDKLKKKNLDSLNTATNGEVGDLQDEKNLFKDKNGSSLSESDIPHKVTATAAENTQSGPGRSAIGSLKASSSSLWDAWSDRVEAVKELRFSLDGSIIKKDLSRVPETGNISVHNGYSANNVSERDFLRTEGDPGAAGYTIKEALALTRSVVPGQRALALHLLASVLDRALYNICHNQVGCNVKDADTDRLIDWGAIWAFALGPEPELSLSLRMSLDDNHNSVVLACAKVIQCILCCEINESFFDISEKIATYPKDVCTAPVFRSRQEIDVGFLRGGFWKYSTKASNILPFGENSVNDKTEGEHTIQDDVVVAGQDFAAGLVRMGILPRIRYLLETDPSAALEEGIISILIAIARHSPTCANAIMKCPRLVQTVVDRFTMKDQMEVHPAKIKSVTLLKVLARSQKKNCSDFMESGIFQKVTWHLYRYAFSIDQWIKSGMENSKLSLALIVEQLRFWKVCIQYGYCVSYFSDLFPALCVWLGVPSFEKLIENNILGEFAAVAKEAYLVLEALTKRLPNIYTHLHLGNEISGEVAGEDMETWCWSHVGPMVDFALKWTAFSSDPYISELFYGQKDKKSDFPVQNVPVKSLLWVISAVMRMLSSVLERVIPNDAISLPGGHVPWLPEFVPKIGLELIRNRFLGFSDVNGTENGKNPTEGSSFIEYLCDLRHQSEHETSIASACCLDGLVQVVISVDKLIKLAKSESHPPLSQSDSFARESMILANGILKSSLVEFRNLLTTFMKLIASEWHNVQSIEVFGRGGPAPGVGLGWGALGGGLWSTAVLLAQTDAGLLIHLLEIFKIVSAEDLPAVEDMTFIMQKINCVFGVCSVVGPRDGFMVDKALDILFEVPVLKYLDICIRRFLYLNNGHKLIGWEYKEEDYMLFSKILASHFKNRWLCVKTKSKAVDEISCVGRKMLKKGSDALETIHEDLDTSNITSHDHDCTSLLVEWAHQRLPLPMHWFLSPISTISDRKRADLPSASNILNHVQDLNPFLEVAQGGLFFLLGIEAMFSLVSTEVGSPVRSVHIIWKLHSLSTVLLIGMGVLEDEKSRVVYETLQEVYGQLLDKSKVSKTEFILENNEKLSAETGGKYGVEFLRFQSEIHESYFTFMETLVEQFAAVSYGDLVYGRQVAIYLHRCVEAPVRLAAWNALSNARVLELLPPLGNCFAEAEGYLEPTEDNESILEAYAKSWISGALDRAATRGSVTFTLVRHHLSSFIFCCHAGDNLLLRNKLVKSLLRDYSRKQQHEGMMVDFIQHNSRQEEGSSVQACCIDKRFHLLTDACEGNSSLLREVEKLKSFFRKNNFFVI